MQQNKRRFLQLLALMAGFLMIANSVFADVRYLLFIPPKGERAAPRNFAPLTSGTLFSRGTPDGQWTPTYQPQETTDIDNFLNPDPTAQVDSQGGAQDYLFQFSDLKRLDRMAFQQNGTGGVIRIYAADAPYPADSPRWKSLNAESDTGSESIVDINFPLTSMRFMRVTVDYPEGGQLESMHLSGDALTEDNSEIVPPPEEWPDSTERIDFDFARSAAGGRVTHIASGEPDDAYNITDGDPTTFHQFDPNEDGAYFKVALAEDYPVYEATISTDQPIRSVHVWLFTSFPDELLAGEPDEGSNRGLNVSEGFLSQRQANGQIVVPDDEDVTRLDVPLPDASVRYVLVKVIGKYSDQPVRVRGFSIKGRVPREYFSLPSDRSPDRRPAFDQPESETETDTDPPQIPVASP